MHSRCAEKRSTWFFSSKLSLFSNSELLFPAVWKKKILALMSKVFSRCAREQLGNFSNWNNFLVMYSERKTSRLWSKILRQESQFFFFFVRTEYFGAFFLRELGFFSDCKPEFRSFGWKVFNSRFGSAFKLCRKSFHLFLLWKRYYFPRILNNFSCSLSLTKLTLISRFQNTCAKEHLAKFFWMKRLWIMYFEQETFKLWLKSLRQKSEFFNFCAQKIFWWRFSPESYDCFGLWA